MGDRLLERSRDTIRVGSKSFAAAARLFDPACREDAYLLYAWCRQCDDSIDGQELGQGRTLLEGSPRSRLLEMRQATEAALVGEAAADPAFRALQRVVQRHDIPAAYPRHLLDGFAMDVECRVYETLDDTLDYCYHVAGVVGLMMAHVMGVRDESTLDRACDLGLAFQLTNIARDVMDDAASGRVYLPLVWLRRAGVDASEVASRQRRRQVFGVAERLLAEADRYYESAYWGLPALPPRRAWAIAAARRVYRGIGRRLVASCQNAWDRRAVVGRGRKIGHLAGAGLEAGLATTVGRLRRPPQRAGLWTRPAI